MNIVHCIFSLNTGGAETMLIDIVNEQVKSAKVTVIIINNSYDKTLVDQIDGMVKIITLDRKPSGKSLWFVLKLNYVIFKTKPDVVHLHHLAITSFILPIMNCNLIYTIHDLNISSKYSNRVCKMFAISDAVAQDMRSRAKCPVVTIPNGINTDRIEQRSSTEIPTVFKIVQVARLNTAKKGQDILIKALSILNERGIYNITVDFIGSGKSLNELKTLTEELGIKSQTNFLGNRERDYIYKKLCKYDIICHPARYEGFGLTVAEGMAAGLPVIVSDEGGPFEIIGKGKYGLSFKNGDAIDLADKIQYMMENYQKMLELSEQAKIHIVNNYSIKRMVAEYLNEYQCS